MPDPYAAIADPVQSDPYASLGDPVDSQQTSGQPASQGFTDPQKAAIRSYLTKAKDAADLAQYAHDISGGTHTIGNAQQIMDYLKGGGDPSQLQFTDPTNVQAPAQQPSFAENLRNAVGEGILNGIDAMFPGLGTFLRNNRDSGKAFTEHAANALAGDYGPEVGGFIHTVASPSEWGDFGSNLDRNVADERAILQGDSEGHGLASAAGELTGAGLAAPLGGDALDAAGVLNSGTKLARFGRAAIAGGIYGSGSAGPGERIPGGIIGSGLSVATDAALPFAKSLLVGGKAANAANQEFAQAADRQGIDYMAADLPNAPKSKFATALSSLSFGGIPLAEQGAKNVATAGAAAERVASNIGSVSDRTGAGQAAQSGARQFVESSAQKLSGLYNAIPIAQDSPAVVANTRDALNGLAQSFQSNPKLAAAFRDPKISAYLDALTPQTTQEATGLLDANGNPITRDVVHGGGLSWSDLKDFRTRIGEIIGQPGLASDGVQMGQLRSLYGALSEDMQATAQQAGPKAAAAFNRANNYARARSDRLENVVSLILGNDNNKGAQSAIEAMQRLANLKGGDPIKLAQALRSMPGDEANTVRATILDDLGRASPGTQNATGDAFSPAQWLTNWNKLSDRAKSVLFTGEHKQALNDLAQVFSGMKSSTKFANSSKTGLFVAAAHTAGVGLANPVLGLMDAALQFGGGKLLASPTFAKRLAATPKNLAGARAFWSRPWVNQMALKNPAIAGEIQAFRHAFLTGANDNTAASLAAQPQGNEQDQSAQAQ